MLLVLQDTWDRQVVAEVVVRRDTVEFRLNDVLVGSMVRDVLGVWLGHPTGTFKYDDMHWITNEHGSVGLAIGQSVPVQWLADDVVRDLIAAIMGEPGVKPAAAQGPPLMLGYQVARIGTAEQDIANGRAVLAAYAASQGYTLGEVFVEHDVNHPTSAMAALIEASRHMPATAIAVPSYQDLGRLPRVQQEVQKRLARETGLPVWVPPQP